jgi:hypothetical protein
VRETLYHAKMRGEAAGVCTAGYTAVALTRLAPPSTAGVVVEPGMCSVSNNTSHKPMPLASNPVSHSLL